MNTITAIADHTATATVLAGLNSDQHPTQPKVNGLTIRNVTDLNPYDRNSRKHGEAQVAQIADSIKEFGFTNPVLIDEHDTIIAGEGRVLAAKKLKMLTVPCIVLPGLTDTQKAAYVIADNKLALNASWDDEMLQQELLHLGELEYSLNLTGFSEVEIAKLLADIGADLDELTSEVDAPQPEAGQPDTDKPESVQSKTDQPELGQSKTDKPEPAQPQAQDPWAGMPECDQPAAEPFRTLKVHFNEQAAVDAFAKLIGKNVNDKTKYVWYPKAVKVASEVVYG